MLAFVIAQTLKLFTYWYSERRWDFTRLIGSGGMPSSHTGCVSPCACTHCTPKLQRSMQQGMLHLGSLRNTLHVSRTLHFPGETYEELGT